MPLRPAIGFLIFLAGSLIPRAHAQQQVLGNPDAFACVQRIGLHMAFVIGIPQGQCVTPTLTDEGKPSWEFLSEWVGLMVLRSFFGYLTCKF